MAHIVRGKVGQRLNEVGNVLTSKWRCLMLDQNLNTKVSSCSISFSFVAEVLITSPLVINLLGHAQFSKLFISLWCVITSIWAWPNWWTTQKLELHLWETYFFILLIYGKCEPHLSLCDILHCKVRSIKHPLFCCKRK